VYCCLPVFPSLLVPVCPFGTRVTVIISLSSLELAVVQARVKERLESRLREFCALGLAGWAPSVPAGHPFMSWDAVGGRLVAARLV
jgi:hypothetical protein